MRPIDRPLAAWLLFASAAVFAQGSSVTGDPNAMPQGPGGTSRADPQADQQAAYERAKADCRKVQPGSQLRRDCMKRSEKDYDRDQRDRPQINPVKPALTPQ